MHKKSCCIAFRCDRCHKSKTLASCSTMRTILALAIGATAFQTSTRRTPARVSLNAAPQEGDLSGKVAFVAGVADSTGYGWAIAKSLAEAGCKIIVGTWPPVLAIFKKSLEGGKMDADRELSGGRTMDIDKIYPLDAVFDTPEDVPEETKTNKRYAGLDGYTISEVAKQIEADYGKIDFMIHSLANGPEVTKPLLETSRRGYLGANSASAYSLRVAGAALRPHHERGRCGVVPDLHRVRGRHPGLRRRHVLGQGRPRERYPYFGVGGRPQVRHPRQHHLRGPPQVPGRLRY